MKIIHILFEREKAARLLVDIYILVILPWLYQYNMFHCNMFMEFINKYLKQYNLPKSLTTNVEPFNILYTYFLYTVFSR